MAGYVAPPMVRTPWGDANTLRERQLSPGRGTPREEARRNQRERLFAAMVAVTAEKGYAETSVADLVELSGVSSRSFYELFGDKEECFLATMDEILGRVRELSELALEEDLHAATQAHVAVETFVAMVAAQPAAAKLCMVSAFCAGETPRARIVDAEGALSALLQRGLEALPERSAMPPDLTQAIVGGVAVVLYRHLAEDRVEELRQLGPRLSDWVLSVPPPPRALRPKQRRFRAAAGPQAPPFVAHAPAERVLRAFASVLAEKGYTRATIADVAARARISQATFYRHFRDKDDALAALLDSSGAQMVAATLPAVRRNPEWPAALRVALEALCGFMAAEPDFARVREVEVYAVGPEAVAQRDRARGEVVHLLAELAHPEEDYDPLAVEATLGAFQSLLYSRIVGPARPLDLLDVPPLVTYLALAPALGADAAWEVACG